MVPLWFRCNTALEPGIRRWERSMGSQKKTTQLRLRVLPELLSICRLPPGSPPPDWCQASPFGAVAWSGEETSVITEEARVPADVKRNGPWRALMVVGPLDFALIGVLAGLSSVLAKTGIPILAVSTFDTDYLLVPCHQLEAAVSALVGAGYDIQALPSPQ